MFNCSKCPFGSEFDFSLVSHEKLSHPIYPRTELYNCYNSYIEKLLCPEWDYETHLKIDFDSHLRSGHEENKKKKFLYEDHEDIEMIEEKCEKCDFQTFSKFLWFQHKLKCREDGECQIDISQNMIKKETIEPEEHITPDSLAAAKRASANFLPNKSANIYEKQYQKFIEWCNAINVNNYSENIFLAYFSEQAKVLKAPTLWSIYSMLNSTFLVKHNISISKFGKLIAFIKTQNVGYKPNKSSTFNREEINRFLMEAPNDMHLMQKVCLIIGVAGACRIDELKKMAIDDIEDKENFLIITIPDSKNGRRRVFTVSDHMYSGLNPIEFYRQYRSLRPLHTPHRTFFIYYRSGKCSVQQIGIHTFGKIPRSIATYLGLPNAASYTGHAFRRTSASLLADKVQVF